MMRLMFDSVTAADIPADAGMVAGYTDIWKPSDWSRFPNAVKVRIARFGYVNDGHVLDVEQGIAQPSDAPPWVERRRAAGGDPTVYCNEGNWPTIRAAFDRAGVAQPHYWVAAWDNSHTIMAGAIAHQFINPPLSGGHFDLSMVADVWPGVDSGVTQVSAPMQFPTGSAAQSQPPLSSLSPQEVAAFVKLAYEVLALRKYYQGYALDLGLFRIDATDPADYNNQVGAVLSGKLSMHDVVNNITEA